MAHLAAEHASASYSRQYYFSLSLIIKYKYRSHKGLFTPKWQTKMLGLVLYELCSTIII